MQTSRATELILIRHAPALTGGRLCGRTDVAADLSDATAIAGLARAIGAVDRVVSSPAERCRTTAEALWPARPVLQDQALWEQDFGAWEGLAFADIPDLGPLSRAELANVTALAEDALDRALSQLVSDGLIQVETAG